MTATLSDIESAVEFVSSGDGMSEAYIDIQTGSIFYVDDVVEEEVPEDLYENSRYLALPGKHDLGLDKNTAIQFVAESLPAQLEQVYEIFSKKGAYRRFKDFLNASDKLEAWYSYEGRVLRDAVIEWCHENSVPFSEDS